MGAPAELHRIAVEGSVFSADLNDANEVAILIAEELHDIGVILDLTVRHFGNADGIVGSDAAVHLGFDPADLVGVESLGVEVKAQTVGGHERTLLSCIRADSLVQSPVEKVGRGVMFFNLTTTAGINLEKDGISIRLFGELKNGRFADTEHR